MLSWKVTLVDGSVEYVNSTNEQDVWCMGFEEGEIVSVECMGFND